MLVLIQVTADDISNGSRFRCDACPLALAFQRYVTVTVTPLVGALHFDLWDKSADKFVAEQIPLASQACQFRSHFDGNEYVEPIKFQQELPDMYVKDEYRTARSKSKSASQT